MRTSMSTPTESQRRLVAKALANPLRARILQRLGERIASPAELAQELGAPVGLVSYHVRMLRSYECIELVRTAPVRGAVQHFYRATQLPELEEEQLTSLPPALRRELHDETIRDLVNDLAAASEAGILDDPELVLSRETFVLDEQGFQELNELIARTRAEVHKIAAASSDGDGFLTELALLHFKRAEPA